MRGKKQGGFGAVQLLATVVIIGLIGGAGWYVWKVRGNTNKSLDNASQVQDKVTRASKTATPPGADPTGDWIVFSSDKGAFSLKYPKTWVQPVNRDACTPGLFDRSLYVGPDANTVLKCGSEYFGQMSVSSVDGDKQADSELGAGYKDVVKKPVTINGVAGQRISGTATGAASENDVFAPAPGTIEVRYVFFTNGKTYVARYTQDPKGIDVLSDFDLMVTKTLKFSS